MVTVRRKPDPEVLEARQVLTHEGIGVIRAWLDEHGYPPVTFEPEKPELTIRALNGAKGHYIDAHMGNLVLLHGKTSSHAAYGDWLVYRPVDGIVRVIKADAFYQLYEEVAE